MTDQSKNTAEGLAIQVSGYPVCVEGKLINVSTTVNGQGVTIADEVFLKLQKYKLSDHRFGSMVFDTPAANTGIHKGAATILEVKLCEQSGLKLLWVG